MNIKELIWLIISPALICVMMVVFCIEFSLRLLINGCLVIVGFFVYVDEGKYLSIVESDFISNKIFDKIMNALCG